MKVNLKSISHRCQLLEVAFVWDLTSETIYLPLGCLQGGYTTKTRNQRASDRYWATEPSLSIQAKGMKLFKVIQWQGPATHLKFENRSRCSEVAVGCMASRSLCRCAPQASTLNPQPSNPKPPCSNPGVLAIGVGRWSQEPRGGGTFAPTPQTLNPHP